MNNEEKIKKMKEVIAEEKEALSSMKGERKAEEKKLEEIGISMDNAEEKLKEIKENIVELKKDIEKRLKEVEEEYDFD